LRGAFDTLLLIYFANRLQRRPFIELSEVQLVSTASVDS
jgi:hypothetical protein